MTDPEHPLRVTADHVRGREPPQRIRRIYKTVSVGAAADGYRLLLDGTLGNTRIYARIF